MERNRENIYPSSLLQEINQKLGKGKKAITKKLLRQYVGATTVDIYKQLNQGKEWCFNNIRVTVLPSSLGGSNVILGRRYGIQENVPFVNNLPPHEAKLLAAFINYENQKK